MRCVPTLFVSEKNIEKAQERYKKNADRDRRAVTYELGEKVWINTKELDFGQYSARNSRKLGPKYIGPFKVIVKRGENAFKLDLPYV